MPQRGSETYGQSGKNWPRGKCIEMAEGRGDRLAESCPEHSK